ncbi:toxin glutamine deamidase domain-containing protein [Micromonospora halophytica]|uniref:Papain fold toxin 1, glutamine deamidase n=1 Tax=Micromonospora halophytica TaxID=47864 RepID=A0A1C5HA40_9ACTN|nr:toxin glutamine deamidase domain-containing protein [Micromonospora halophytica]SCG42747.1 Papain fold toxin 1, glutamine deamidase [Micromonospora halophytica]
MSILPSPIPHPLQYSPWDLPGWVYEAFDWVIGVEWPEGDERAVWDLADQWYAVASTLTGPRDDAITAAAEVRSGYGGVGLVAEAFDTAWRRVAEGDDAPLAVLLAVSSDLGRLVEECGCDIEGAKLEVWIELGILVVELISLAVAAVLTAGAASPAAAAAITATRVLVQQIFKRLLAQLAKKELKAGLKEAGERAAKQVTKDGMRGLGKRSLKGGLEEAAEESGINLATQAYQNTTGRRDGLDMADLGASAVGGLAGGAVAPLAGLGRHAQGRGGRIAEHFGREMTGETMAEGAASLATGQGTLSLEDAARAAVSGATGSATGQADAALRARLDSQLGALAAPVPSMDLPPAPPVTAVSEVPSPRSAPDVDADTSTPTVSSAGVASAGVHDSPVSAMQPDPAAAATRGASPALVEDLGSTANAAVSLGTVGADGSTGSDSSSASPTLSSVAERLSSLPHQPVDMPATAGQSTAQQMATATMATAGPVTPAPATSSATAMVSGSVGVSATSVSSAGVAAGGTSLTGGTPPLDSQNGRAWTAAFHTPVAAPHSAASTAAAPSHPGQSSEIGADSTPKPAGATTERNGDASTARKLNRFPELEVLAPKTAAPPPSDVPPPVSPSLGPGNEEPRPRTPEWYAAKWAAEREALERRRYQGYFESQRAWYEDRRRRDLAAHLLQSASHYLDRARWLKRRARQLVEAGLTLRAEHMFKASSVAERDSYDFTDWADAVRDGRVVPEQVVIDDPADFQRINDDVAELAIGAVETSDRSALTWDDHPPPIDRSRPYGRWGGLRPPLALHQTDLERAMPRNADGSVVRTADPRQGGWFALANDGGSQADPTRGINCLDCTLSLYDTWMHGRPRVSAPRTFDGYTDGDISRPIMGEQGGPGRVEEVTGGRFQRLMAIPEHEEWNPSLTRHAVNRRFDNLQYQLQLGGHGSYAFLITEWESGGSHAWVALNQNGTILYLDPQSGAVRDQPLYGHAGVAHEDNVVGIDVLILGGDGRPMPLGGLARGRFSALPDLPDYPSVPDELAGAGDPYLNRLYLLDGPGSAAPVSGSEGEPFPGVPPAPLPSRGEPNADQEVLRRERDRAVANRLSTGASPRDAIAVSRDLGQVFLAGITPAEVAAHLDVPTLRRLVPHLDEAAAKDVARFFADPQVRHMLDDTWRAPPRGEPMLAEVLVRQLTRQPDLVRMVLDTPELAYSLTARPVTLHHLAGHQQAINVLGSVLDGITEQGAAAIVAGNPPLPAPTPLSDDHRQISASVEADGENVRQPGFDRSRLGDAAYCSAYLDDLYASAAVAQAELNRLAQELACVDDEVVGRPGWRLKPKDRRRAEDKIEKYRGDAAKLIDLAAAKVEFQSLDQVYAALSRLRDHPGVRIVRYEDRFVVPQDSGYRDIQLVLEMSNGHLAEFRLHLAVLDEVAGWEHALFEVRRDLKSLARKENRALSVMEKAIAERILRHEQQLFWRALLSTYEEMP